MSYFGISNAISKHQFLETYKDIAFVSQLLVAPLGIPYCVQVGDVLGEDAAAEEYSKIFRQWEEIVSRAVYAKQRIPDDRVASSMHLFLEIDKDEDVLKSVRNEADNIKRILNAPQILEMPTPVRISDSLVEDFEAGGGQCHCGKCLEIG